MGLTRDYTQFFFKSFKILKAKSINFIFLIKIMCSHIFPQKKIEKKKINK
jgi:hypothetical protein